MNAADLLAADATTPHDDLDLLDAVWPAVCDAVGGLDDLPQGVLAAWFWSRLCVEEVQGAGLAELQSHPPDELPEMIAGWERLGRADVAELLTSTLRAAPSRLEALEDRWDDLADELDALHVQLLRHHREAFLVLLRATNH